MKKIIVKSLKGITYLLLSIVLIILGAYYWPTSSLEVKLNGNIAEVVSLNKVEEYASATTMYGYLIQIKKPKTTKIAKPTEMAKGYDKITIKLRSKETNEFGMGEYFVKRVGN